MPPTRPVFLFAFANDSQGSLRLGEEQNAIWNELADLHQREVIDCQRMGFATLEQIYRELNRFSNKIVLFHYGGHSDGAGLNLQQIDQASAQLADKISQQAHLKLVFLNGCSNFGQVEALFKRGVPAVIATMAEVEDQRALALARQFYQALAAGHTIYEAFESARSYVINQHPDLEITHRAMALRASQKQPDAFSWGLYSQNADVLNWRLPGGTRAPGQTWKRWVATAAAIAIGVVGITELSGNSLRTLFQPAEPPPVISHFQVPLRSDDSPGLPTPPTESIDQVDIRQSTTGNQSPAIINTGNAPITISYDDWESSKPDTSKNE